MCGIAVHLNPSGRATPIDLRLIRHRGPDSSGEWTSPDGRCWLGNTRLAIVDLSPSGAQPMTDPVTGNVIVINGEIYNHKTVRVQLGSEVTWQGTSDTETVLQGYGRWGHDVLLHLKGMFAFAIYDAARKELFLARDRLGIKPLYYISGADGFRAASETRALVGAESREITGEAISGYLQWGACPERALLYRSFEVLPAGHAMTIGVGGETKTWRYWPARPAFSSTVYRAPVRVRELINRAVTEHLLSDVPVASFLSGGIDSSIVTAIAAQTLEKKLQTFSVGFEIAEFDETERALEIAKRYGTDHHRIQLSETEVLQSVTEAVEKLDLPSVDAINTYVVSRAVASHGVKVALSGLGGDELFGGYASFRDVPRLKFIARLPRSLRRLCGIGRGLGDRLADMPATTDAVQLALWRRRFFTDKMIATAELPNVVEPLECPVGLPDDYARISWAELTGYMRRMLLRDADQMSMAVSLELRVPFLDHELVEYVLGLPVSVKQAYSGTKGLLVEACRDLLPPSIYDRPKAGFVLPMRAWMLGPLGSYVEEGLREAVSRGLVPQAFTSELKEAFRQDKLHWTRLWSLVVLGQFAKRQELHRIPNENTAVHSHH
jgi:asparagine synthase (glutamine-hydrolysing)